MSQAGFVVVLVCARAGQQMELERVSRVFVVEEAAITFARLYKLHAPGAHVLVREVCGRRRVGPDLFDDDEKELGLAVELGKDQK